MTAIDLMPNYLALAICILTKRTPEMAFAFLDGENEKKKRRDITEQDIKDMIELKKTMTYREIGELYGLTEGAVCNRIRYYKNPDLRRRDR